jgi:hypothetical protein
MVEILLDWNRKSILDVQIAVESMRNCSGIASCKHIETGTPVYHCQKVCLVSAISPKPITNCISVTLCSLRCEGAWLDEATSRNSVAVGHAHMLWRSGHPAEAEGGACSGNSDGEPC